MRLRLRGRSKKLHCGLGLLSCAIVSLGFADSAVAQALNYGPPVQLPVPPAAVVPQQGAAGAPVAAPAIPGGAAAPGGAVAPGAIPEWIFVPSLEVSETYNDNVNLAPRGQQLSDFITAISPGFTLLGQTPRLMVNLTYNPQELLFAQGTAPATLQQRLIGTGHAEILRELLFFDANAAIDQEFVRNNGPIGPTTLTTNGNLQTVQTAGGSPYLLEHFGSFANSETRYRFSQVTVSGNTIAPAQIQEASQKISSGNYFGPATWTLFGDYTVIDRLAGTADPLGGTSSKDELVRADGAYPIYQALAVIGGIGFERVIDPTLIVPQNGLIWNAGLQYQPNPNIFGRFTYGRRFEQNDYELLINYFPSPALRLHADYSLTAQTSSALLAGNVGQLQCLLAQGAGAGAAGGGAGGAAGAGGALPAPGCAAVPFVLVNGPPGTSTAFGITSGSFLLKSFTLAADLTRERNTYNLTLYRSEERRV